MTHALFDPLTLRDLEVRNRIWVPPMCQYSVHERDGRATDWHLMHYGALARGGAGAVIVEATGVVPEGRIAPQDLGLWNDEQREALTPIVELVHSQGAAIGIQLAHAGRKASTHPEWGTGGEGSLSAQEGGWETVAPSAIAFPGLETPRALDAQGIEEVVTAFADAAGRAAEAGFDLVEIHAAHGYLLHEFLSPLSNRREDEHGGSLENRSRLLLRVVDAVRARVGEAMPVLVRLSGTDWVEDGLSVEEVGAVGALLKEHGVDLLDISSGGNITPAPIPVGPGYQVPLATAVRAASGLPTAAVGMISEPFQAEQILATELADVVLIGRELLRDPNFPLHAARALRHDGAYIPPQYARAHR
ncbi:NADH:flavin oxidoreductase/NADH oxidase [Brachybacterium sp. YJGR34]|uniref:NADH:flavin oxidoreductase/NADH oxidase n=1 Tax=Brachybacterium sp. YJGR34 TaxID=2059911 RepID=UPI000E0BAC75|nr:NADH:flavin oxidoreductase/NADH oxidase [Brachybacterium sp. YJGR34]